MSPPKVLIGIVTNGRSDSSLQAAVSILQLQMQLMSTSIDDSFQADLRFYNTNNDALEDLYKTKDAVGLFVIHWSSGIPGPFAMKSLKSSKDFVVCVHPDGIIDWDRVRANIETTKENLEYVGMTYNVDLEKSRPDTDGYAKITKIKMLDSFFVKRAVVDSIARKHPTIISKDKQHGAFALDGVYDGKYMTGPERFMDLYGKPIYADLEHQINKLAPQDFSGVVGNRSQLR